MGGGSGTMGLSSTKGYWVQWRKTWCIGEGSQRLTRGVVMLDQRDTMAGRMVTRQLAPVRPKPLHPIDPTRASLNRTLLFLHIPTVILPLGISECSGGPARLFGETVDRNYERTERVHLVFAISSLLLFSLIGQGECDEVGLGPKITQTDYMPIDPKYFCMLWTRLMVQGSHVVLGDWLRKPTDERNSPRPSLGNEPYLSDKDPEAECYKDRLGHDAIVV
ncbi:unnamed protein product [Brassica oleracea var. botrytis]